VVDLAFVRELCAVYYTRTGQSPIDPVVLFKMTKALNTDGGFGTWVWDVSRHIKYVLGILNTHNRLAVRVRQTRLIDGD
jgi:hypothetical protein